MIIYQCVSLGAAVCLKKGSLGYAWGALYTKMCKGTPCFFRHVWSLINISIIAK